MRSNLIRKTIKAFTNTQTPPFYLFCRHGAALTSALPLLFQVKIKSRPLSGDNERVRRPCTHCVSISRKLLIGFMCKAICSVETRQREKPTKAREEGEDLFITCGQCPDTYRLKVSLYVQGTNASCSTAVV